MKREQDGQIVTQFDYPACESLGLIKMDFLGLRNLTIIDDALDNIAGQPRRPARARRPRRSTTAAPTSCSRRGDTLGVFQLDGGPMRALLRLMKPDNFEDISAVIALYRPGPMGANSHTNYALRKNGLQEITPIHPELAEPLAEILGTTYGLIIYQEQVMAIAQKVAGFTLGQADILRRAMGKKKKSELDKQFEGFKARHERQRLLRRRGQDAVGHPAAVLRLRLQQGALGRLRRALATGPPTSRRTTRPSTWPPCSPASATPRDKLALYLNECRRMGIKVLPPDVNESIGYFAAVGDDIRFGLGAVRNVGFNVVEQIIAAREEKGALHLVPRLPPQGAARTSRTSAPSSR